MRASKVFGSGRLSVMAAGLMLYVVFSGMLIASAPAEVSGAGVSSIRTPPAPAAARINGPSVFGVRPRHPFFYQIPVTGDRPIELGAKNLPEGLRIDSATGQITGRLEHPGEYAVTLTAQNARGRCEKPFRIIVGETIALTPPMGWNSWNCWGPTVDAEKVLASAHAMVSSGLINHGWTYINIDDAWQRDRGGEFKGIQPNEKFPDMKALCDEIHKLGLKVGIYSTPWTTSYAHYIGGSSDDPAGTWTKVKGRRMGTISFADNDARQWATWGIDYLKYDWNPKSNTPPQSPEAFHQTIATMAKALRNSGRDIVYSYSNSMPFGRVGDVSGMLNCWRTSGDIRDNWKSMSDKGFGVDKWAPFAKPGHWNDPDMMVVGYVDVGKGRNLHPTHLTPDEQYAHVTLWCLVNAPLLLGCDMARLDAFTLNLLTNDEVLAVSQDALGQQAVTVRREGDLRVYAKKLEDGSTAVGLFNTGETPATVTVHWSDLGLSGPRRVRDLWRQRDLGESEQQFGMPVSPHGAELVKIYP